MSGDPDGTIRWWDGHAWTGHTAAMTANAPEGPAAGSLVSGPTPAPLATPSVASPAPSEFRPPLPDGAVRFLVPEGHRSPPAELWLISAAMSAAALLLIWPVLRYGGPLLGLVFGTNEFGRAIAALILMVLTMFAALAAAFAALAVGLLRASRVAQILTVLVSGVVAVFALLLSSDTDGAALSGGATAIIVIISLGVAVGVLARPAVRAHFGADTRPLGVTTAAVANAFFGWVLAVDGVLMLIAGVDGARFVLAGLLMLTAAAALVVTGKPLKAGSKNARTAVMSAYAAIVIALILLTAANGSPGVGLIVPLGAIIAGTIGLTVPESSKRHFEGRTQTTVPS